MDQHTANILSRAARVLLVTASLLGFCATRVEAREVADVVVLHGKVYTVDAHRPWAQAIAVRAGKIVAVGTDREIARWHGPKTRVLDAGGHLVLPGFTDSHIHFLEGAISMQRAQLADTTSIAEIQRVLREYAAAHPATDAASAWIMGRGWSYPEFPGNMPHKKYLDELFPDRPVVLEGFDGHTYWANSVALRLAGITRATPDPVNGKIVRDENGEPTGALQESAADAVIKIRPQPSRAGKLRALQAALAEANRVGLTRVISCGNDTVGASDHTQIDLFDELRKAGQLSVRFYISTYAGPDASLRAIVEEASALRTRFPAEDPWLAVGAVKFFLDGVIEGHTAAMLAPYADLPGESGALRWDEQKYKQAVRTLDAQGFQVFTHAIGDRAVRLALDTYGEAQKANATRDPHHRIEHIETVAASDIPRFGALGVVASFQPLHAYPDEDTLGVWLKSAGAERGQRAWAWHSIAAGRGVLAFGSDWPVVTMDPWRGIQNALTRQTLAGKPEAGFVPNERITLEQAIAGYTTGAAIGGRHERTEGSLTVGKVADLIVISQDLFAIDPHTIYKTKVLLTMVEGRVVYDASAKTTQSAAHSANPGAH